MRLSPGNVNITPPQDLPSAQAMRTSSHGTDQVGVGIHRNDVKHAGDPGTKRRGEVLARADVENLADGISKRRISTSCTPLFSWVCGGRV